MACRHARLRLRARLHAIAGCGLLACGPVVPHLWSLATAASAIAFLGSALADARRLLLRPARSDRRLRRRPGTARFAAAPLRF